MKTLAIFDGKKTLVGLVGFIGCKLLARVLPEVGEACDTLADYVFAPLAGLGAWHKLSKIERTNGSAADKGAPPAPPASPGPGGSVSYERFGPRRGTTIVIGALVALALSGCASLQGRGLARAIGSAAEEAAEAAVEEANLKKHLREFWEDVEELLFGEEEIEAGEAATEGPLLAR